ncbi:hypothetical protein [Neochlamydia sp. S13]|uniref:hypothetical protein n=1 Tax=Neochlamydia sp. S13 TaxID=1353976 RepID=UPI0005AA187A|nr:hypothetical protein [Neochlamydia sp. S13]BBI17458.1 hypothetical protein NCS13_1_1263 [Neochlamydia sp. S13]
MSLTVSFSCTRIRAKYDGKKLTLIKKNSKLNWKKNPVLMTAEEKRAINFEHIMAILQGDSLLPSALAGLDPKKLSPEILVLDRIYRNAIKHYIETLKDSSGYDEENLKKLRSRHQWTWIKIAATGAFVLGSTGALGGALAGGGIGAVPAGTITFLGGLLGSSLSARKLVDTFILREGSTHRLKWIQSIDLAEKNRLENMQVHLELSAARVLKELQELEKDEECSVDLFRTLQQHFLVNQALFPQQAFIIEGVDIATFLLQLKDKFAFS